MRAVLLAFSLGLCLVACSDGEMGLPPWHMWGNSQTIKVPATASFTGSQPFSTQQILKIAYGRPETWRWFFEANITDGNLPADATARSVVVVFKATIGVGRSSTQPFNLGRFRFDFVGAVPTGTAAIKYTNNINAPVHDDSENPALPNVINTIVAQDIQLVAEAQLLDADPTHFVNVNAVALFAPETHVRPEWFKIGAGTEQFPGGEDSGK